MCFFEPAWLFHLKFKLSKAIYFLRRTWFLYILWKYQGMFKVLQWNARLWKTPTLKIARSSPGNSIFIGHASNPPYRYQNTAKYIKFGLKIILIYLSSIINFDYSIPFSICHNTTKRKELFSIKGTTFVSSDWWISGLTPISITCLSKNNRRLVHVMTVCWRH